MMGKLFSASARCNVLRGTRHYKKARDKFLSRMHGLIVGPGAAAPPIGMALRPLAPGSPGHRGLWGVSLRQQEHAGELHSTKHVKAQGWTQQRQKHAYAETNIYK